MKTDLDISHEDIEALIRETDDYLDISALKDSSAWAAMLSQMKKREEGELQKLLTEKDQPTFSHIQGLLAGIGYVKELVAGSSEAVKTKQEELAERQRDKDELIQAE